MPYRAANLLRMFLDGLAVNTNRLGTSSEGTTASLQTALPGPDKIHSERCPDDNGSFKKG
jgi:hypothetical protein